MRTLTIALIAAFGFAVSLPAMTVPASACYSVNWAGVCDGYGE